MMVWLGWKRRCKLDERGTTLIRNKRYYELRTTMYESNNQPYMFNTSKICWIVTRALTQPSHGHLTTGAAIVVSRWSVHYPRISPTCTLEIVASFLLLRILHVTKFISLLHWLFYLYISCYLIPVVVITITFWWDFYLWNENIKIFACGILFLNS